MIPYDLDPSLHNNDPKPRMLDDGFSAPAHESLAQEAAPTPSPQGSSVRDEPTKAVPRAKSAF